MIRQISRSGSLVKIMATLKWISGFHKVSRSWDGGYRTGEGSGQSLSLRMCGGGCKRWGRESGIPHLIYVVMVLALSKFYTAGKGGNDSW